MSDSRDPEILRRAAEFIAQHEGCHLFAYPDPASPLGMAIGQRGIDAIGRGASIPQAHAHLKGDPWTIGYGQTGKEIKFGVKWTLERARDALTAECAERWRSVQKLITAPLAIPQAAALISFHYNLGDNLASSTLRKKLNKGDYTGAAAEFDKWVNAGGQRMAGLVTRRAAERALFESALTATSVADSAADELQRVLGK